MYNWFSLLLVSREREAELLAQASRVKCLSRTPRVSRRHPRGLLRLRLGAVLIRLGEAIEGTRATAGSAGSAHV